MPSIETKLRTSALAYPDLATPLGYDGVDANTFRWWDTQLRPGKQLPAIVVSIVSDPDTYTFEHRLSTSFARIQFEIWSESSDESYTLQQALEAFLDQFNGYGVSGLVQNANQVVNKRKTLYANTQPARWQRIVDAMVFSNSTTP